ncbi:MAG: acetyl-CoA C-acetyltransferase, partial [Acinetobacter calcoaceticus]
MTDIVIVNGARTAMGGFQGSLSGLTAPELGAVTIKEAIARAGLQPTDVEE